MWSTSANGQQGQYLSGTYAGNGLHCFGGGSCVDCVGADDDGEAPGEVAWSYVGPGRGYYEKVQGFNYVGEGGGEWVKEDVPAPVGRQLRPQCRCLLALVAISIGGGLGYLLWPYIRNASWLALPVSHSPEACAKADPTMSIEMKHVCCTQYHLQCLLHDCDDGFTDWRREWSVSKKAWCCQHTLRGCPPPGLQAPPGGRNESHMPQPEQFDTDFDCNVGYENFRSGWSIAKKAWCCHTFGKACPPAPHDRDGS